MSERALKRVRCAIYTRKSSEEGLEQAFNSLHAQREACEVTHEQYRDKIAASSGQAVTNSSPVTSRSNWAKERSTFSVSRPIEVVVLKDCVIDTNDTEAASKISTILAKSKSERVRRSIL